MQKQPSHSFLPPVTLDRETLLRGILDRRVMYWRLQPAITFETGHRPLGFLTHEKHALLLNLENGCRLVLCGLSKEDAFYRAAELRTRRAATGFHLWN